MRRRRSEGGAKQVVVVAVAVLAVVGLAAAGWWWSRVSSPARAGAEAARAGRWEEALATVEPGLVRPGFDRDEREIAGFALLALGRADEGRARLAEAGGAGAVDAADRVAPPGRLAAQLLAAGRERELRILTDYLEATSKEPLPADLEAHAAFAAHAEGDLSGARKRYAELLAGRELSPELRAAVEGQSRRAEREARDGHVAVVLARDGTVLAWRVAGTEDVVAGPELAPLTRGAAVADLPGLSPADLYGQVVLSLDPALQRQAASAFRNERGAVVVLDPATGDVLAAAADSEAAPLAAFTDLYQPGSTLKAATMAAYLASDLPQQRVVPHDCRGNDFVLEGEILYDWTKHGTVDSLDRALAVSCNTVFAKVALALGAEQLRQDLSPFGFADGRLALADGAEVPAGTLPDGALSPTRLARAGMGLDETRVTPLQAAMLAATLAEGGQLHPPRLVVEKRNVLGQPLGAPIAAEPIGAFPPAAARAVAAAMVDVVQAKDGTGRGARSAGLPVALKTGTTGGDGEPLNAVFVGFAPPERPDLAFALFTRESGRSLDVSRRVLGPWLEDVFRLRGLVGSGGGSG